MTLRFLSPLAAVLAVGAAAAAKPPVKLPVPVKTAKAVPRVTEVAPAADAATTNQRLAESVAARLANTSVTDGSDVSLVTDNGTVTVTGGCRSAEQKAAILGEVRVVPGVKLVKDGLSVGGPIMQAQAAGPVSGTPPAGVMPPMGGMPGGMSGMSGGYAGPAGEPYPVGNPGAAGYEGAAPPLPPHAWPTYAPYNNVSRVAYPQSYPYNAFPFIGPFYPFPKVPLGWRSVNLQWEDGHWFMGRTAVPHDYWRARFW